MLSTKSIPQRFGAGFKTSVDLQVSPLTKCKRTGTLMNWNLGRPKGYKSHLKCFLSSNSCSAIHWPGTGCAAKGLANEPLECIGRQRPAQPCHGTPCFYAAWLEIIQLASVSNALLTDLSALQWIPNTSAICNVFEFEYYIWIWSLTLLANHRAKMVWLRRVEPPVDWKQNIKKTLKKLWSMMLELLTHLCSLAPSYGTASRTCLDCYKEHDMHHSKPIEDIESLTAKQILCQRKSKALTTIFGGNLSKAAPQLVGGNTKAICSSCQGTLGRLLYSISGRGKKAAPVFQFLPTKKFGNGHHPSAAHQIYQVKSNLDRSCIFSPFLLCTSALSVAFRKCGSLEVATLIIATRLHSAQTPRAHLDHGYGSKPWYLVNPKS